MSFILTAIGILLLLATLAGVGLGLFMGMDSKNRDAGYFFAIWWVPGVAAASGVVMRDIVTFSVGALCFLVAGAVFVFKGTAQRKPVARRRSSGTSGEIRKDKEASS